MADDPARLFFEADLVPDGGGGEGVGEGGGLYVMELIG